MSDYQLSKAALEYHRQYPAGKLEVVATKPMSNQNDLSLAYSPGVAVACEEIKRDVNESYNLTNRGNTVAIISNGTAVLGLGDIGPYAAKPVMEGKAVLFKRFAGINGIDIELDCNNIDKFCDIVVAMEPSFGGINLEDIKAPECFEIEKKLVERMSIPVFHDDQHGTAIIVVSGLMNALELIDKKIEAIKIVCNGAGAAGLSILDMLCAIGADKENITLCDSKGIVHNKRSDLNKYKQKYSRKTNKRTLEEAMDSSDVFIGVSVAGVVSTNMLKSMNINPIVFALANPTPEIMPNIANKIREDVIMATGRTDFPNQINNVLCFPFLFRGALDVAATEINMPMKIAAAQAIASLAKKEVDESASNAYVGENLLFSKKMLIPKPFDLRLIEEVAPAVAKAAMDSGVATRPIDSIYAYKNRVRRFVNRSASLMQNIISDFQNTNESLKRVVLADGEDTRVLNAAQMIVNDKLAFPVLIGRKRIIGIYCKRLGLRMKDGVDMEIVDPENDRRYKEYHTEYHAIAGRNGVSPSRAKIRLRTDTSIIGSMLLKKGEGDTMLCGLNSEFNKCKSTVIEIIGLKNNITEPVAVNVVPLNSKPIFITDTRFTEDPDVERLCETAFLASEIVKNFEVIPKIAFIAHQNFGGSKLPTAIKMKEATALMKSRYPNLQIEGEVTPIVALDEEQRNILLPENTLQGSANLLVMPNVFAANIAYGIARCSSTGGFTIGPIIAGLNKPVSILSRIANIRSIYNLTAVTLKQFNQNHQPTLNY